MLALVAVLAAILVPAFVSARRAAAGSTCLSNERSLGQAMLLYLGDHDDAFPDAENGDPGGAWVHLTFAYVKSHDVYHCPADPTRVPDGAWWVAMPADTVSYGLNDDLPGSHFRAVGGFDVRRDVPTHSGLAAPSRTVMFFEVADAAANPERSDVYAGDGGPPPAHPPKGQEPIFVDGPTGNTASDPMRHAITGGDEVRDWAEGQSASGPEPEVLYATGPVGGRTLNGGKAVPARHVGRAIYLACDGHARALRAERVSGGADAADASCDQGTTPGQAAPCAAQSPVSAAGTGNARYALTFSAR